MRRLICFPPPRSLHKNLLPAPFLSPRGGCHARGHSAHHTRTERAYASRHISTRPIENDVLLLPSAAPRAASRHSSARPHPPPPPRGRLRRRPSPRLIPWPRPTIRARGGGHSDTDPARPSPRGAARGGPRDGDRGGQEWTARRWPPFRRDRRRTARRPSRRCVRRPTGVHDWGKLEEGRERRERGGCWRGRAPAHKKEARLNWRARRKREERRERYASPFRHTSLLLLHTPCISLSLNLVLLALAVAHHPHH